MRLGSAGIAAVLTLLVASSTSIWGWTHASDVTTDVSSTPCSILKAGTALASSAVGSECPNFAVASNAFKLDCRTVASLPSSLVQGSWDFNKSVDGGGATIAVRTDGCHFDAPAYNVEGYVKSASTLDAGPLLLVADFVPPASPGDVGFLFGCDGHCIDADLDTETNKVYLFEDGNKLVEQQVQPLSGTNRLVVVYQGQKVRVWLNGTMVTTESITRVHGAGNYYWFHRKHHQGARSRQLLLVSRELRQVQAGGLDAHPDGHLQAGGLAALLETRAPGLHRTPAQSTTYYELRNRSKKSYFFFAAFFLAAGFFFAAFFLAAMFVHLLLRDTDPRFHGLLISFSW